MFNINDGSNELEAVKHQYLSKVVKIETHSGKTSVAVPWSARECVQKIDGDPIRCTLTSKRVDIQANLVTLHCKPFIKPLLSPLCRSRQA